MTASVFSKTTKVVSLLLLLPMVAVAQQSTSYLNLHQWGAVTLFHGLPSDRVRAIAQDRDGWLWFGTDNGLARYDGRRVQKIASKGLPAGAIRTLIVDPTGRLWAAGDGGASVLFSSGFKPVPETAGVQINAIAFTNYSYGDQLKAVLASEQGKLFFCSLSDSGEFAVETLGAQQQPLLAIGKNVPLPLTSLLQTQEGLLVGSMGRGVLKLNGRELKEVMVRPRHYFIRALASAGSGRVWVGIETRQREGLYLLESGRLQAVEASTGAVTTLYPLADGQLWAGTTSEGAFFRSSLGIEQYTFESSIGSLRSDMVLAVFVDREGVIWFGTDRGVCRYDARSPRAERISEEPESNFVRALLRRSDGSYWVGTNRGLFMRRPSEYYWTMVEDVGNYAIFALLELPDRRLLVGAASGLYVIDDAGVRHISRDSTSDSIRDIASFRGRVFLAAYGVGLEVYEGGQRQVIWQGEGRRREVLSLYAEGERLWIGTAAGLFVYEGKNVTPAPFMDALEGVAIRDLAGTESDFWLATDSGLYRRQDGQLTHFLRGTDVRSLAIDGHNLWCAADTGLYKLRTDDPERLQSRLDTEFGLPSANAFVLMLEPDARVWVGTNRGLASYTSNKYAPILRAARALGSRNYRVEEIESGLFLEYPQNSLLVDYLALSSRTFPEQFLYRFILRDASGRLLEERQSRDGQFLVEQLTPGRYSLEARAFTHDLVDSEKYSFTIQVASAPFPWTSAALSALLLAALSALWWGYNQNRKLASSNLQLAQTRLRLAEETEKERRRISRDLHDQTLADLRKLLMMTDKVQSEGFNPAIFRAEIESISTEIRRICEDLSPSVLTNVGLSAALEWALQSSVAHMPAAERFEYEFLCDEGMEERLLLNEDIEIQIYRIVQEVINNICRHSRAHRVKMTVALSAEGDLRVSLEDDGQGMGKSNPEGRGLGNIRSRASMIDASVQWKEREGGGVCFLLFKRGAGKPL